MSFLKGLLAEKSLLSKVFFLLSMVIVGLAVAVALSLLFSPSMDNLNSLKLAQAIQTIFVFLLPSFVCAYLFSNSIKLFLKLNQSEITHYLLSGLLVVCLIPTVGVLAELNEKLVLPDFLSSLEQWMKHTEARAMMLTQQFLSDTSGVGLCINIFVIALIPAIAEEVLFRGVLQRIFSDKYGVHRGIWLSAIIFSAVHFQFYGFVPRMFLGVILGYIVHYSSSIFPAILAHFTNNLISVLVAYFLGAEMLENTGYLDAQMLWVILASVITSGVILFLMHWISKNEDYKIIR